MDSVLYTIVIAIAFLFAAVGHGGGSGYIMVLTLYQFPITSIKTSCLLLTLLVSGIAFIRYYRKGHFDWKKYIAFASTSIPAAFLGGMLPFQETFYKKAIGIFLLITILFILDLIPLKKTKERVIHYPFAAFLGLIIGFVSGSIGIGGGILLSPIILVLGWSSMKETAGISALFIFFNSLSALGGVYLSSQIVVHPELPFWTFAAFSGGILGAWFGSSFASVKSLKFILSGVLFISSLKLLWL